MYYPSEINIIKVGFLENDFIFLFFIHFPKDLFDHSFT